MFEWRLESITFSNGDEVSLAQSRVFILVGPNRAGKSTALRNIEALLLRQTAGPVVTVVKPYCRGTEADFTTWLSENYPQKDILGTRFFVTKELQFSDVNVRDAWSAQPLMNGAAMRFLCRRLDTETRLTAGNYVSSVNAFTEQPQAFIHVAQTDERIAKALSKDVKDTFGVDLLINWAGGNQVGFHVGDEPLRDATRDRVHSEYVKALNRLPRLEHEGDGIRSFVGTLLAVRCGAPPLLLIDEPEAFLHPPQVRRLAELVAKSAIAANRQLIVATHSSDFVQSAVSAAPGTVAVCRVTREKDRSKVSVLVPARIKDLTAKPLLQSASAIDGIFHEGVVVCEAYADCKFYEAVARLLESRKVFRRPLDLYYVQGGGKGELATLAEVYRDLGVRCAVIADLDLLKNEAEFKKVVLALGGDPTIPEANYRQVVTALTGLGRTATLKEAKERVAALGAALATAPDITTEHRRAISTLLADTAEWSEAKKYGVDKLKGQEHQKCEALLTDCKRLGLFLVPKGELECWWRGGPAGKNEWIGAALTKLAAEPELFIDAAKFVEDACVTLGFEKTATSQPQAAVG